jgi:hypothetical protein
MRSEAPPPIEANGPATIPIGNRTPPTHEAYEKENAATADRVRIDEQLAQNRLAINLAQLSEGSDFPAAMQELNDVRKNLRAPRPAVLKIDSDSPHTDADPREFNTWVERRLRGEFSDIPPAMGEKE